MKIYVLIKKGALVTEIINKNIKKGHCTHMEITAS